MAVNFRGYVFNDAGAAISGATVALLETGTTTQETSTTTDSNGLWSFSEPDQDRYDVKITYGSSVRYIRWDDQISLKEIDVRNNTGNTTPAATFTNITNNASNQVAVFSGANSTRADGDEIYLSFKLADSAGNIDEFARMTVDATDVTTTEEDGQIRFSVMVDGTLTDVFTINSTESAGTTMTLDVSGDLTLDADGGDIFFKDGGTTFGSATNNSGNLIIKSGTTTALTFDGADVTVAGDVTISGDDLKMATNTDTYILVADGTSYNPVAVSGDVTIANNGAVTIANDAVESGMVNDNIISGQTELASGGIAAADEILISDGGTVKKIGVDNYIIDSPALVSEAAIANGDYLLFLDGGATGSAKKEALADLVGLIAGTVTSTGLSDSGSVLSLDIQNMTASTTIADADLIVIDDGAGGTLRKMTRANFIESAALDAINIDGGAIDGTPIGANSASTIAGTTIDASTDFTIGSTVITDDSIVMTPSTSDTVTIAGATNGVLNITTVDNAAAAANLNFVVDGAVDVDAAGAINLDSGSGIITFEDGGTEVLRLTEGNSGDVTVKLVTNGKDLIFTDNGDAEGFRILDAAAGVKVPGEVMTTKVSYTDGDDAITIADGGGITAAAGITSTAASNAFGELTLTGSAHLDSSPSDEAVSGITATFTAGEDLVRGEVVYFKAGDSKMWKAVATASGTMPVVAMAAADISADADGVFLLQGFLADNGTFPSYTVAGTLYAPEAETSSQNVPEQTAPDTDGDFVQVVGFAVTANSVYFNPSNDVIEHA